LAITVAEALKLIPFKQASVIAGKGGLSKYIKGVTVIDSPDVANWLKGGELLLTTTYAFKDNPESLYQLLEDISNKRATAVVIKLSRFIQDILPEVLELADRLDLPLIDVPFHIPWIDIINPVTTEIIKQKGTDYIETSQVQERLLENIFAGGDVTSIVYLLSELINKPIAYYDASGNLLAYKNPKSSGNNAYFFTELSNENDLQLKFPVKLINKAHGQLVVVSHKKLNKLESFIVNQVVIILTLEIYRLHSVQKAEQSLRDEFLYDLLHGRFTNKDELLDRAEFYKLDLSGSKVVMVIFSNSLNFKDTITSIEGFFNRKQMSVIITRISDLVVAIFDVSKILPPNNGDVYFVELAKNLMESIKGNNLFSIGIGRIYNGAENIKASFQEAKSAVKMGNSISGHGVYHYSGLGFYRLLINCHDQTEIQSFYDQYLGKLSDCDDELINTLRVFLNANGNISETANKMFFHYNTIKYRLNQIEKLLNMDLKDPEVRFNLLVALRIKNLLQKNTFVEGC